jgi:hypothetical protein
VALADIPERYDFGVLFLFVHFPFGRAKGKWTNNFFLSPIGCTLRVQHSQASAFSASRCSLSGRLDPSQRDPFGTEQKYPNVLLTKKKKPFSEGENPTKNGFKRKSISRFPTLA